MDKTILENTLHTYFLNEIASLQRLIERNPYWFDLEQSKTKLLDRCYGVQEFAQQLGLDFQTIDKEYTELRETVINL